MNNNDFSLRVIAALDKQLSKRQIKSDLKTMDDSLYIKVISKLSKTLSKRQLKKDLKQLNDLYVQIGANVKVDKNAKSKLQNRIKELQKSISDIEIKTKVNAKSGNSGIDSARRTMQSRANRTSVSFDLEVKKNKAIADIEYLGKRFSKLFSNVSAKSKYENILTQAYSISDKSDLQSVRSQIAAFTSELKANNLASQSLGDKWKKLIDRSKELFSAASIIRTIFTQTRQAVTKTIDLDKVYTDLVKVNSELNRNDYSSYLSKCNQKAQELATTQKALIEGAAEFSKSGYDLSASDKLTEKSTILSNVGEMSASDSAKAIISGVQAYDVIDGYTDVEDKAQALIDKYNEIGNTASITTSELAQGVQTVGSVFADANTDVNQFLALLAAGNRQFQDADALSLGLRTSALRIRGCTAELEEMGEETDTVVTSASKLEEKIKGLTNIDGSGGVEILEADKETFRSMYDIYADIGKVYKDMSDTDQSALLELIAGKNRASAISATLNNMSEAEEILQNSLNAAGSAQKEYDAYLDSTEAHIQQFQSKLVETYSTFLNGDMISNVADLGTVILDLVNKTGLLKHSLVAIAAINIGKGISAIGAGISSAVKQMDTLGGALQQIKNLPTDDNLRNDLLVDLGNATKGLTEKNLKLLLSQQQLSYSDKLLILQQHNLNQEEAKAKLEKMGLTATTNANTTANTINAASVTTLKGTFTKLTTSIKATWAAMSTLEKASLIFAAVSTAYSIASSVISSHNQALEEAKEKTKELADEAVKEEENIESLIKQYNELDKTDRSTENTEKIKSLNESINEIIGNQADNLDLVNGKLDEQSEKLKRNLLLKLQDDQGDIDANVAATSTEYEKGISFGTFGNDTSGDVAKALYEAGIDTWYKNSFYSGIDGKLNSMSADEQLAQLKDWRDRITAKYKETGNYGAEVELLNKWYNELNTKKEERDKALQDQQLRDEKERILSDWDAGKIDNAEAFKAYRDEIQETYKENSVLQNQMLDFIDNLFPDFAKKLQETKQTVGSEDAQPKSFKDAWDSIGTNGTDEQKKAALETKEKLLELAEAGKLTVEAFKDSSIAEDFMKQTGLSADEATEKINKLKSSADQLASMKTGISSISSILGEKKENQSSQKTRTKGIGADTLAGMPEDVKAQTKEYEHFVEVLGDGTSKMEDCKDAANKLATAYVTSNNFLSNLTDDTKGYYTSVLKEMGVENAESLVSKIATANKEKLEKKTQALEAATKDMADQTSNASKKFADEAVKTNLAKAELADLVANERIFASTELNLSDKITELNKLAEAYFNVNNAISLPSGMGADPRYYTEKSVKDKWEKIVKKHTKVAVGNVSVKPDTSKSKSGSGSKKDKSKSKSTHVIDWIDIALTRLSSKLDLVKAKYDNLFKNKKAKNSDSLLTLQNKNLDRQYKLLKKTEKYQTKAQEKYTKKANSVKLDESLKKAVREGRINGNDMSKLIATYGEKKAKKIQEYQDWYDKARDAEKNRESTKTAKKENRIQKYQNIVDNAEENRSLVQARKENATTAAAKNYLIREESKYLEASYDYQIKIATLEKDSVKVAQLKAEKTKEIRDLEIEGHQNLADEYQSNLDMLSAQKENLKTAAEKNAVIESEKSTTQALYAEKITIAQIEGNTAEALQLQAELAKTLLDLDIERHQNLADEYQMTLDKYSAAKALATTAADMNSYIDAEKQTTQALYDERIAIANLYGKTDEALQLQYEKEKALRDLEVERHQNLADEHQSNLDMLSVQKDNLKTSSEKNAVVDKEKNLTVQLYNEKMEIARIEGNTSEELKLQAELDKKLVEFEKEKLDNIVQYYKNLRKINENISKNLSNSMDELEARGLIATRGLYEAKGTLNDDRKRSLEEELIQLERQHDKIEEGTQAWFDSLDQIQECKDEIAGCVMNAIELGEAIRNIDWKIFDKVSSRFDLLSSEYDLGIELMSDKQLTDKDTGNFTREGTATLGAYYSELLLAQEKTSAFKRTHDDMKKNIDEGVDGYTDPKVLDEYNERYEEYIELVKSEHSIQKEIIDMMKQKYQEELDHLQDIINKRKELLQVEKDAYDYQRSIEEKTKNVAVITKQMAALNGDGSEATKTRLQQLQVSLDEAQKDLQDTEYNQWLSDQQKMLDNLYNEYSDFIEDHLNDTDALIREAVTYLSNIKVGESVGICLNDYYAKYGYDPTDDFENITNELGENGSIVKAIGDGVNSILEYSDRQQRYQAQADDVANAVSKIGNVFEDPDALRRYEQAQNAYDALATAGDNGDNIQKYVDSSTVSALNTKRSEARQIYDAVDNFEKAVSSIGSFDDKSSYTEENRKLLEDAEKLYNALSTSGKELAGDYKNILQNKKTKYEYQGQVIRKEKEEADRAEREAAAQREEQANATRRDEFIKKIRETYLADGRTYADMGNSEVHNEALDSMLKQHGLFRDDGYSISAAGVSSIMNQLGYSRPENRTLDYMYRHMKNIGFSKGGIAETLQKIPGLNGDDGWVTVQKGEGIFTPEQTQQFINLVRNAETLNPAVDLVKNLSERNYDVVPNQMVNQTVGDIHIELPNVTNYEDFRKQMQSDPKIEKMFKSMIWDKGSFSKYKITM